MGIWPSGRYIDISLRLELSQAPAGQNRADLGRTSDVRATGPTAPEAKMFGVRV